MPKVRKMLGAVDSPYIVSLMRLIETQSKVTLASWCLNYASENYLPLFEKYCPGDGRASGALSAARDWLNGKIKLPAAKQFILGVHAAARELEENPTAQAAARAVGQAAASIHTPTHSLGMAFYGSAAVAYDRVGIAETPEVYDMIAAEECARIADALRAVYVEDEKNLAKINWNC